MASDDKAVKAAFVAFQLRQAAGTQPSVTCGCGAIRPIRFMFRCLYCGEFYCQPCAEKHFGKSREQRNAENRRLRDALRELWRMQDPHEWQEDFVKEVDALCNEVRTGEPFEWEWRYYVLKLKDVRKYLGDKETQTLLDLGRKVAEGRAADGRHVFNAVVVEQDWPEFDTVQVMIRERVLRERAERG